MEDLIKKIKFRSIRRGSKEMDILIGRITDNIIENLSPELIECYNNILKLEDHELYDLLFNQKRNIEDNNLRNLLSIARKFLYVSRET